MIRRFILHVQLHKESDWGNDKIWQGNGIVDLDTPNNQNQNIYWERFGGCWLCDAKNSLEPIFPWGTGMIFVQ